MPYPIPPLRLKLGISLVLLAALSNAIMILFVKLAENGAMPTSIVIFSRFFVNLLIVLPFLCLHPHGFFERIKTKRLPFHLFRDVLGFISLYSYFFATKYISLAGASTLFNTAPLFIPLIVFFWLRIKIYHQLWWGLAIGFIGILLMLQPSHEIVQTASFIGLFSGLTVGITMIAGRLLSSTEPATRTLFYYFLVGTILAFIVMVLQYPHFWQHINNWKTLLLLIGVGVFGYFYQIFLTSSSKYAPVRLTSSFLYTSVIFSLFFDFRIFHHTPNLVRAMGIILIIAGAVLLVYLYPEDDSQKVGSK